MISVGLVHVLFTKYHYNKLMNIVGENLGEGPKLTGNKASRVSERTPRDKIGSVVDVEVTEVMLSLSSETFEDPAIFDRKRSKIE